MSERRLPPVTAIGMTSLALIVAGGIYLSAHLPDHVAAVLGTLHKLELHRVLRIEGFDWAAFVGVAKWALLAYAITAGLIGYVFVRNHVSGGTLVVLGLSLVVYAVHVPMLIGFTVARYADA